MNRFSIKTRVALWYTLVLAVLSAITLFAMLSVSERILINDAREKIVRAVDNMVLPREMDSEGMRDKPHDLGAVKKPITRFYENGVHMAVLDEDHTVIAGMLPFDFVESILLQDAAFDEKTENGDRFLIYVRQNPTPDGNTYAVGVVSVANERSMLASVAKTNLVLIAVLLLVAGIGGYYILRQALKPVDKIRRTASEISESNDLSQRIALGEGKDEVYRLAATFDKMLDKIEKTLQAEQQFTADASHELRTPIAVIHSECEYAIDCADSLEEVRDSVTAIKRQSDKMTKLIDELLTLSRMDRKAQIVRPEEIDVSELLQFVCDEQEEIHEKNVLLERTIPAGVSAKTDRGLLTRLLINLIANAYQYGKDKIAVTLSVQGEKILFAVADNGIGIAEEEQAKIWERFYQVDSARTNAGGSMGLGLSMVKQIAECLGGSIAVESELGVGSVFTFTLPKA